MADSDAIAIPHGFRTAAGKAGIKPSGGPDLAVFVADGPCAAAGTFTTNRVCAAPVKWCRGLLPADDIRAIVVNAGNANAATGAQGAANAERTAARAAELIGCEPRQVLVASTGVIGHQLPMDKVEAGLDRLIPRASADASSFDEASRAILTTDTHPKVVSLSYSEGGVAFSLLAMAKGAAMIGPRMATMLAFILTDAPVWPSDLQPILLDAVEDSFNCLSVEGHASTNDTVLILSSTASTAPTLRGEELTAFAGMVRSACESLARMMAADGEGATHFITIDIEGCRDREEARAIAREVAESALVKTAIHGADPNWGRIVSAAGYAGVDFDEGELSLWINGVCVYEAGAPTAFDAAALSAGLKAERDVTLRLALRRGEGRIRFWTCDLTAEYVHLNADYTT
ncbi:Arginine biosynthesis bifunctional protein ArgJ [Aquisphaera giovannonii]|uniref:Arginine biosynthesis bifunctional protein ArgJ n=1 Tax=Aquisphaera giovannonii TaxID=406548 RepID=A0A5B9WAE6_9BACT|nr:bifunctional glutamate N-acetyltransferase/amino-acid acetyltransferase ArgJ [Aquisphaera giovannonii]QEH37417.1 Arginine biosynthesis bifunctional protein ArgJ [Aquisphaera giovannonii]